MSLKSGKCYLISAGEYSGDLLAADMVHSIRVLAPELSPVGIVGDTMLKAGVQPIARTSELSVMGVVEVAKRVLDIRMLEQRILAWVDRANPEFAILVDFPGFHFRLAEQLKLRDIPVYQYVAPKAWAWGKGRLSQLRENFTRVLGVLPFEEEFFLQGGVEYTYVGSPHFDRMSKLEVDPTDLGFTSGKKIIAFLPGSRMNEIRGILPVMMTIKQEIKRKKPNVECVVPFASSLVWEDVLPILGDQVEVHRTDRGWRAGGFTWFNGWSLELMKIADAAVVASGTATLECALAGTPMSVVYVMNDFSFAIAKRFVKLKWVSLVNLLMNREIVREHIQYIDPKKVADEILELMEDSFMRRQMLQNYEDLSNRLMPGASDRAAQIIVSDMLKR